MSLFDLHVSFDSHSRKQMDYAQAERKYQHLHRIIQRIEPYRVYGYLHAQESSRKYRNYVSEPSSEQGSPYHSGDAAVEEQFYHLIRVTFKFEFFKSRKTSGGHDYSISGIAEHHTEKYGVKHGEYAGGVKPSVIRQRVHLCDRFKRYEEILVIQKYRNFVSFFCLCKSVAAIHAF